MVLAAEGVLMDPAGDLQSGGCRGYVAVGGKVEMISPSLK